MSKIFNSNRSKELEFIANQQMDSERRKKNPDGSMSFVGISLSVLGNSAGKTKTSGEQSGVSTGGSFQALYGSEYCVADLTIPFEWEFGKGHQNEIMGLIASIQTKFSQNLTEIQGKLSEDQEKIMRDSAMRSQAIREAKGEIKENEDDDFDQMTFNKANAPVRAKVISDMSLNCGIECSASIGINSEQSKSVTDRGWKRAKNDPGVLTHRQKEKGLKSVYLMDSDRVQKAQEYVYNLGEQMQKEVLDQLSSGWTNECSLNILKKIDSIVTETKSKKIKIIPEYSPAELDVIRQYKEQIIKDYDSRMNSFE